LAPIFTGGKRIKFFELDGLAGLMMRTSSPTFLSIVIATNDYAGWFETVSF
jgi:hypothetical protein